MENSSWKCKNEASKIIQLWVNVYFIYLIIQFNFDKDIRVVNQPRLGN